MSARASSPGQPTSDWIGDRGDKWRGVHARMEAMLAPVDAPLFEALALEGPARIVDVGSGAGGSTLSLARRVPRGSVVHGFDVSPSLVEIARARLGPDEGPAAFDVADMGIARCARPYDRLVSRFGVMFFDEPVTAFANLARWLVPQGRLALAVWAPASDNPWMTSVRDVVARAVDVPRYGPDAPGPFRYADADLLLGLLERAGLGELHVREWRGTLPIGGGLPAAEAARFALSSFSSFGELLATAGESARARAQDELAQHFAACEHEGVVRIGARVHLVLGQRR